MKTKSVGADAAAMYSPSQRGVALLWGALCHGGFLIAVAAMAIGLFTGMHFGKGTLSGSAAFFGDLALLLQFAVIHSWLLSSSGRKWLARLPLAGVGGQLATTTFAISASIQIFVVFWFWSPMGEPWLAPHGALLWVWCSAYAGAWLLLLKAMGDSCLALQTGFLGWGAVWQNRRPEFSGYAMRGLYRLSRQPIYIAFALILWTAPNWTPDHLAIALVWSAYCVIGPRLKEQRFLQFYGQGYQRFKATVPYWLPWRRGRASLPEDQSDLEPAAPGYDVVIAGAGPIGLTLANLLGREGRKVLVVEARTGRSKQSRAIGVTPPSLKVLKRLGLIDRCLDSGVKIRRTEVLADEGRTIGSLGFDDLPGEFSFILSLPQSRLEEILEQALVECESVTLLRGCELSGYDESSGGVRVTLNSPAPGGDSSGSETREVSAQWLAACDGARSELRSQLGVPLRRKTYPCSFAMADFDDRSELGSEARLFFTASGAVESFPLPNGQRRWIVQRHAGAGEDPTDDDRHLAVIDQRTGWSPQGADRVNEWSCFTPQRQVCDRFFHGRTVFCGDAAHVMSPIGGQGMNVGFGDAEMLAPCLTRLLLGERDELSVLQGYDRQRQRAFARAARLAAGGMWLGTRTGARSSALRGWLISRLLLGAPLRRRVARHFAMLPLKLPRDERLSPFADPGDSPPSQPGIRHA